MTKKFKGKHLKFLCVICFALCFFAFMLTEAFINERCVEILGSSVVNVVYTLGLVFTGFGFLSFPIFYKLCKVEKLRKIVVFNVSFLCFLSSIVLLITENQVIFIVSSIATLFFLGHIGSYMYYNMSIFFAANKYMGRMIGIGMGAAIFLQFVVQNLIPQFIVFMISILLSITFVMRFIIKSPKKAITENLISYSNNSQKGQKTAITLIVSILLMSFVVGIIDSVLTSFNAEREYAIYSGVRLFYAFGLILAGFIADIRKRDYLPLATVCALLLSSICIFFLSEEASYFIGTALMYLYSGFYVIFFTVMFIDFAPKSKFPELWASMGRIVRSFTVAITIIPTLNIYNAIGSTILAAESCLLSILNMLVLLPYISNAITISKQKSFIKTEVSQQESLKMYANYCYLTPRETEVLERLLTTDDDLQEIANTLYISRRMVQRYISSIYEKTKTKTRIGLFQNYMDFKEN